MYDRAHSASLGMRDVIAAWMVCLAIAGAAFAYPGFVADPAGKAQAALGNTAPAASQARLCAVDDNRIGGLHG